MGVNSIGVVIVNWNSGEMLRDCIKSLTEIECKVDVEIVVVDNNSSDNSDLIYIGGEKVLLIKSNENVGFARACNLGANKISSDYVLFLNPDASVYGGTIEKVMVYMEGSNQNNVGICGVQLIDESGHVARSCSRFPTPSSVVLHALGLNRIFPTFAQSMTEWPHDKTKDVNQVIGAFFCVRRALFDELNGFDERFFVYFEEVDFSYRARLAGWRCVYLADVQAFHAGGGTSNQVKAKRLFYSLRSRLLYAFKHFHMLGAMVVLLTTLFIEPISRSALAIARRSWSSLAETWQGYGMLWRWLPQWIFKGVTR